VSTFGSRSFAGKLTSQDLKDVKNSKGFLLREALLEADGDLTDYEKFSHLRENKKCYLEVHIEQGLRLERENKSVAIVTEIVGIYRDKVIVKGQPNHAGTTMMHDRKDALTTASELILTIERIVKERFPDMVGTVGKFDIFPNAANIVPGSVEFILEIRGKKGETMDECLAAIYDGWDTILSERGLSIEKSSILRQSEVVMDSGLNQLLQKSADSIGIPYSMLHSMAGHDASHTVAVCPTTMIFVKSIDGKSHCPEELSLPEDIKLAADLLLKSIIEIDSSF
jgi:hydantoinase/carbamoylase family amidase